VDCPPSDAEDGLLDQAVAHLESCADCQDFLDHLSPDTVSVAEPRSSAARFARKNLLADLVDGILQRQARLRMATDKPPADNALTDSASTESHHCGSVDELACQLAPGQILRGRTSRFVVKSPMGFGDFTETYEAEQVVECDGVLRREPAVIKIPRVAHEMSDEAAAVRLRLLSGLIRVVAQDLQSLGRLEEVARIIDCGEYVHRLRDHAANSTFVAYQYVAGPNLVDYMRLHYATRGRFCGLPTAKDFALWARPIVCAVHELHNRLVLHGDICPSNVLVTGRGQVVLIDVGQSIFRDVMSGANGLSQCFYRAPEGINTPGSDLFSVGGLLYFLATGKEPIGLGAVEDKEQLKQQVALKIKQANPALHKEDAGVADIIAMCLRKYERVQSANQLLRDIDTFWSAEPSKSVVDEMHALVEPAERLEKSGNSLFRTLAGIQARALRHVLDEMSNGVFDVSGSPHDIRAAANQFIAALGEGDEFVTVTLPPFWFPHNIGTNGRFLSMCRNAAARRASVRRVFLLDETLSDRYLQEIVSAQLRAVADLDPSVKSNFAVRYLPMSAEKRRRLVASGRHFGLLVKGGVRIAMFPIYDTNERLVTLRFRSEPGHVEGLREKFEAIWSEARPLVDLRLPTSTQNIDALGDAGALEDVG
jgi:serine/threonine protein kinase